MTDGHARGRRAPPASLARDRPGDRPAAGRRPPPAAGAALAALAREVVACERCPRLRRWCRLVAAERKRAHAGDSYWGKPVPGWGDARARVLVIGLAPAAHGANRTGRMFTGDSSGDWLYRALHRAGFASRPRSLGRDDGLELERVWITAACRCAPPANRPTPAELRRCAPFLAREAEALGPSLAVLVALGGIAWQAALGLLVAAGARLPRPRPRFGHGAEWWPGPGFARLLGSYHPSRQNTNTGRLSEAMLDRVFARARRLAGED